MQKYIIFILIFNIFYFTKGSDVYEISDHKQVAQAAKNLHKIHEIIVKRDSNQETIKKDDGKNKNSVKKELANQQKDANGDNKHNSELIDKLASNSSSSEQKNQTDLTEKNSTNTDLKNDKKVNHSVLDHPGAALRGFYVFLGLSILIIIYFIFKAFRLRPGAPPPATVRKYGIVGRRSDMEMLPLPLAEDEDDDTLFEMGTQINR